MKFVFNFNIEIFRIIEVIALIFLPMNLDPVRQGVVLEMDFNLGLSRLKGFKNMLAALRVKNYTLASREMLASLWARQVGGRAKTLADIMTKGDA